jgi:hypothetical protein
MTEEDEAFEELSRKQGDWGMQGSRKHQIMRYVENAERSAVIDEVAKAVLAEREACAKVCDDLPPPEGYNIVETSFWDVTSLACGDAIRARGQA